MSIDTEHQNSIQITAPVAFDSEESGGDTQAEYPFERFPSPPGDEPRNAHVPNATASLDPPLMAFTYPPPSPLANDPTWYAQMVADVHRNRAHVNTELELARTEAAEALADVTLAEIELKAERDKMQDFLNRLGSVAGKNFVRKMIREVEQSLKGIDENLDDQYEEELQDSDHEDLNGSDESEAEQQVEEDLDGGTGEIEEEPQDAEHSCSGDDGTLERSESPSAPYIPSPDCPQQYLQELCSDGEANFWESPAPPPENESLHSSPQGISHQPKSPNWRRGDITDDEYSSGEDDTSRNWTELSPAYKSRKRHLEVEEEETNGSGDSPRKKLKETHPSPLEDVKLFPLPARCFYPPEPNKDNTIDEDHNSDEEYEVENSLTLEHEPELQRPYLPRLNRLERDPYRVRQNSRGEPELYVPGRRAIEFP